MKKQDFIGTKSLIMLALRRDRVKLPLWILGITLMLLGIVNAYAEFSPQDMRELVTMASSSPGMRLLIAPVSPEGVTELGQFFLLRMSVIISVLIAMMSIQIVIRHTRNNEETGCAELIGSTVVGRYASLSAAIIVGMGANIILGLLIALVFIGSGLQVAGAFASGASFAALGIVFTAIAAITAQLSESGRGSSGLASLVLAVMALVNSLGNVMGTVNEGALGYKSAWPVWLSPIGWTQQVHAFGENNWWILILFVIVTIVLVRTGFILVNLRDVGRGMIAAKPGPKGAAKSLLSPIGLAWRLQGKTLYGWAVPIGVFAFIFGAASSEFASVWEDLEGFEHLSIPTELFLLTFIGLFASIIAIYTMQSILRMYGEENGGPLELTLATAVSRKEFVFSHVACSVLGSLGLMLVVALGITVSSGATSSDTFDYFKGAIYHFIALVSMAGVVLSIYGLLPRVSKALSWVVVLGALFLGPFFGPMFNISEGFLNISPFTHVAGSPADVSLVAVIILLMVGLIFGAIGLKAFSKRNLSL